MEMDRIPADLVRLFQEFQIDQSDSKHHHLDLQVQELYQMQQRQKMRSQNHGKIFQPGSFLQEIINTLVRFFQPYSEE